jgi:hypothetical protein
MGEVGSSKAFIPRIEAALRAEQIWMSESCKAGFDGWLHWGYYEFPPGVDQHPPWTMLMGDGLFLRGISPMVRPDPCSTENYEPPVNLAAAGTASAYNSLPGHPPHLALDGRDTTWESGKDAPGWFEITLAEPARIETVTLWLAQWPAGKTRHKVTATLADGTRVAIADHIANTEGGQRLSFDLGNGLPDVHKVRIEVPYSPSWVSFHDVEILRSTGTGEACLLTARSTVNLRGDPTTDNPPIGKLPKGMAMLGVQRIAQDPYDWFKTAAGSYVRADVVAAGIPCMKLLE